MPTRRASFVERHGIRTAEQADAARSALATVRERRIQRVRLVFADQHGVLRGKTIVAEELDSALQNGIGMTTSLLLKDLSHRTVYPVWSRGGGLDMSEMTGAGDFVLVPDPTTFRVLPWASDTAWILGDCYFKSGAPVPFCTRRLYRTALERLKERGFGYVAGLELEFYIFRTQDPRLEPRHCTQPPEPPAVSMLAHGFQYLTELNYDQLEPVFEQLQTTLTALGLPLRSMEAEFGPSQCELTFGVAHGLAPADNVLLVRSAVKQVCRRSGLHATFMCRPALPNALSSGWHLHQSLCDLKTGRNAFVSDDDAQLLSVTGREFAAGLLTHAREACILATPTINGYKRYRPFSLAPRNVVWGRDNRGAMLRVIGGPHDPATHLENRVGEPGANPYLYFTSQIVAGLAGIEGHLEPPPLADTPYETGPAQLPGNLLEAIGELRASALFRRELGDAFVDYYLTLKEREVQRFLSEEVTDWEQREYFEIL